MRWLYNCFHLLVGVIAVLIGLIWSILLRLYRFVYLIYFRIRTRFMSEQQCNQMIERNLQRIEEIEQKLAKRRAELSREDREAR